MSDRKTDRSELYDSRLDYVGPRRSGSRSFGQMNPLFQMQDSVTVRWLFEKLANVIILTVLIQYSTPAAN
jgi:hypothetical protein